MKEGGLINKILSTTDILDCNPIVAPFSISGPLGHDPQGKEIQLQEIWNYTCELITELIAGLGTCTKKLELTFKYTVHEDNDGAIRVATCPRLTHASTFIAVKYHWFRHHAESGEVKIVKINFNKQLADIITKTLQRE
eukprot:15333991-Ditylum_brightwellii.AAC.1